MRLIVDDDYKRCDKLREAYGRKCRSASNLWQALGCLTAGYTLTHIYLDHDGVDGDLLARWMAKRKPHPTAKILIHSANVVGSQMMYDTLKAAGYDVQQVSFEDVVK